MRKIQADNPAIKSPYFIQPNQLIALDVPMLYCPAPIGFPYHLPILSNHPGWFVTLERNWKTSSPDERSLFSWLAPVMLGSGGAKLTMIENTFKTNSPILVEMVENYESYKRGQASKGQYDYRRSKLMSQLTGNLGPTNLLLNGTTTPSEVLRISRTKGTAPTQPLAQQLNKMNRIAKAASHGGVVLSVVGLGITCHEIANAKSQKEKNEILVEGAGGLLSGMFYGVATGIGIALMATPVGWVGALVIGVGSVAVGYGGSKGAKILYDMYGKKIDFASKTGVGTLCSANRSANVNPSHRKHLSDNALSVL